MGKHFEKGNPGRPKGSKNKQPSELRDMVLSAAGSLHKDGLEAAFKEWLDASAKHRSILWAKIIPQLLPKVVEATITDSDDHAGRMERFKAKMNGESE